MKVNKMITADTIITLRARVKELEVAMERIVKSVPCLQDGGGLFFPMFDGEGNEIGIEYVDPMTVIQEMSSIASDELHKGTK